MSIQHVFSTNEEVMTDGSGSLWEVITDDGERIASCTDQAAAEDLAMQLNMTITEWCEVDEADRVANIA
jgi:hypothetical protein